MRETTTPRRGFLFLGRQQLNLDVRSHHNNETLSVIARLRQFFAPLFQANYQRKVLVFALLSMVLIALWFWSQSRLPALDTKAQLGDRNSISAIAFDILIPIEASMSYWQRVWATSVNWAYTNWKGMSFGLLFAGVFMTLLQHMPSLNWGTNRLFNSFRGMFVGVPLSVCVNCTTPIAHSMYQAGARLETMLATLMSSPTLNVIVLTMSFTLLPFHLALIKLIVVLIFILIFIPILVRVWGPKQELRHEQARVLEQYKALEQNSDGDDAQACSIDASCELLQQKGWLESLKVFLGDCIKNLWFIVKTTLPFMLIAGVLGALTIEAVSFGEIKDWPLHLGSLLAVAVIGVFLPVPIAFDIVVVGILIASGLPIAYCMVLLFALGIYSIYPALVIGRYISWKLSSAIFFAALIVAATAGYAAQIIDDHIVSQDKANVVAALSEDMTAVDQRAMNTLFRACHSLKSAENCLKQGVGLRDRWSQSACDELKVDEIAVCRTLLSSGQKKLCAQVEDHARIRCMLGKIPQSIRQEKNAEELCQGFELDSSGCTRLRYIIVLDKETSVKTCQQLADKAMTGQCFAYMAWQTAVKNADYKFCQQVSDVRMREGCEIESQLANLSKQFNVLYGVTHGLKRNPWSEQLAQPISEDSTVLSSLVLNDLNVRDSGDVSVYARTLYPSHSGDAEKAFTLVAAEDIGITHRSPFSLMNMMEPFKYGRGVASGDINQDGWLDLVFAMPSGVAAYINVGGKFKRIPLTLFFSRDLNVFAVALVDLNADGWLDLYLSTYQSDNIILWNQNGQFDVEQPYRFHQPSRVLTIAPGFADLDADGDVDIYEGNWSIGTERNFRPTFSENIIWKNQLAESGVATFQEHSIEAAEQLALIGGDWGETLSVLLSDLDQDGKTDIAVANDRVGPDLFYFGSADGQWVPETYSAGRIPSAAFHTMSFESADFNNDGLLDIFSVDLMAGPGPDTDYCDYLKPSMPARSSLCWEKVDAWEAVHQGSPEYCLGLSEQVAKDDCLITAATVMAHRTGDIALCELISETFVDQKNFCRLIAAEPSSGPEYDLEDQIPQTPANHLLMASVDGRYQSRAAEAGVDNSYWAWNAKAADLDLDGYLDIYVGNGYGFSDATSMFDPHANVFYHNQRDGSFKMAETAFGLDDWMNTPTYTLIDIDADGDQDLINNGIVSQPRLYLNNSQSPRLVVSLKSSGNNKSCISCFVTLETSRDGEVLSQIREIKASGGFLSFDAPLAFFGIPQGSEISKLVVRWPDQEETVVTENLLVNQFIELRR